MEEAVNGVTALKVEAGEQEEAKQPRVTKAQKRRVSGDSNSSGILPKISPTVITNGLMSVCVKHMDLTDL